MLEHSLRRLGRRAAIVTAAAALIGAAVPATTASAGPSQSCSSVFIVGIRGSGQTGDALGSDMMGPQAYGVVRALVPQLTGRTTATRVLYYTAASTELLKPRGWRGIDPFSWYEFFASIDNGIAGLHTTLDLRAQECPRETVVLVGYSQGAMVARQMLGRLARGDRDDRAILSRIAAVGLVADPHKRPSEPNVGTAPGNSVGAATMFGVGGRSDIPSQVVGRVWHLCNVNDLVCDTGRVTLTNYRHAESVHSAYSEASLAALARTLVRPILTRSAPA